MALYARPWRLGSAPFRKPNSLSVDTRCPKLLLTNRTHLSRASWLSATNRADRAVPFICCPMAGWLTEMSRTTMYLASSLALLSLFGL